MCIEFLYPKQPVLRLERLQIMILQKATAMKTISTVLRNYVNQTPVNNTCHQHGITLFIHSQIQRGHATFVPCILIYNNIQTELRLGSTDHFQFPSNFDMFHLDM